MTSSLKVVIYICLFTRSGFFCLWKKLPISRFRFLINFSSGFSFATISWTFSLSALFSAICLFIRNDSSAKSSAAYWTLMTLTASAWLSWSNWFTAMAAAFSRWSFWRLTLFWHCIPLLLFFSILQPSMYFSLESEDIFINHLSLSARSSSPSSLLHSSFNDVNSLVR